MKEKHKSLPQILIESAEKHARETRQEIQRLKDYLRKKPEQEFIIKLLTFEKQQLSFYDEDIKEMRKFYNENIVP